MSNNLKQDLRTMKIYIFQYLQQLRSNPDAKCGLQSYIDGINLTLEECKFYKVKNSASRIDRIKNLKKDIEKKKQEYYSKCKRIIELYSSLDLKIQEVEEDLKESSKCSILYLEKVPIRELLLYSFRISGTTAAPAN